MSRDLALQHDKEKFWLDHIQRWEIGKQSQVAYCAEQNISFATFGYWRKQFNRRAKVLSNPGFIEAQTSSNNSKAPVVQILLANGVRIGVSHEAPIIMIQEIFKMISVSC